MKSKKRLWESFILKPISIEEVKKKRRKDKAKDCIPYPSVLKNALVKEFGFHEFMAIQRKVIPIILSTNHDVCVGAPTGCGKTLAYAYPIVYKLISRRVARLRALVVLPTRDLAFQVFNVFLKLCKYTDLKVFFVAGKVSFHNEKQSLQNEHLPIDIIVSTPGRLVEHLIRNTINLKHLSFLVVDEADRLLEQSYQDWLLHVNQAITFTENDNGNENEIITNRSSLFEKCSALDFSLSTTPFQKLIFSATLTRNPRKMATLSLNNPQYIYFSSEDENENENEKEKEEEKDEPHLYSLPKSLKEKFVVVKEAEKPLALISILKDLEGLERLEGLEERDCCLVFTSSVDSSHQLYKLIKGFRSVLWNVEEYSSRLSKVERTKMLARFISGETRIMIATDSVARGMDVNNLKTVINYDVPIYGKAYLHRAGRTARAGKSGTVITLCIRREVRHFKNILNEKFSNSKLEKFSLNRSFLSDETNLKFYEQALKDISF